MAKKSHSCAAKSKRTGRKQVWYKSRCVTKAQRRRHKAHLKKMHRKHK